MTTSKESVTRNQILDAAARLFADLGYDKAGISAIAKAAGVNSALIYYYFKNKGALLKEILETFVKEANGRLIEMAGRSYTYGSPEMLEQMRRYNEFLLENEGILRIMMMESLRGGDAYPPLFRLIDFGVEGMDEESVMADLNDRGFNLDTDPMRRRVVEFFTGIMPQVAYSLFRSKWCKAFGIAPEALDALYDLAVEGTHGAHHRG
jgi:AcrR family transcriptional regulator